MAAVLAAMRTRRDETAGKVPRQIEAGSSRTVRMKPSTLKSCAEWRHVFQKPDKQHDGRDLPNDTNP
jgi:hypothetical protein